MAKNLAHVAYRKWSAAYQGRCTTAVLIEVEYNNAGLMLGRHCCIASRRKTHAEYIAFYVQCHQ